MLISIIIPVLNEEVQLSQLLPSLRDLQQKCKFEIIVADGGSDDCSCQIATSFGVTVVRARKGRAHQMNQGAEVARGDILYFVHADTIPPVTFFTDIQNACKNGYSAGCFRLGFKEPNLLLRLNSFFTRLPYLWCRGGDQTLFISRMVFEQLCGFDEGYSIMEEYDFIRRLKARHIPFRIIPKAVLTSTRKYQSNGYARVQLANFIVFNMFRLGYSPPVLKKTYQHLLH